MPKLLAVLLLLFPASAIAQEVGYLDLTGITPREDLRYPPAPPAKLTCKNGICGVGGGFVGAAVGCGAGSPRDPRALKTTLTWLDRMDYQIGDNMEVEIKLENTGSEVMLIPWTPHLADLQPQDESQSFDYLELDFTLEVNTDSAMVSLPLKTLYGSKEAAGRIIELPPGAWVRVRDSVKLVVNDVARKHVEQQDDSPWEANVHFGYRHDSFHPGPGGYSTTVSNDYPRSQQGDPLPLRIHLAGN